ncbi:hypothetical protein F2Q69_00058592 [Brassica cretica]|uniref:Uncharacterized protein n=1 Tax=Brassica cretica TaxID=69181 RepID=A0A8S9RAE2_BRACR|nr:hypothetical protein F2Q69_00058592 [Brassica cretica]
MHGLTSYRRFGRARSLRSDRAWLELCRYVATEQNGRLLRSKSVTAESMYETRKWSHGHNVAIERPFLSVELGPSSVATSQPNSSQARSLRSDRAAT